MRRHRACRFFGVLAGDGLPLNEAALDGVERREFVVALLQFAAVFLNAEEPADEVFQIRRDFDDQFRSLFQGERCGVAPCGGKPFIKRRGRFPQMRAKMRVETDQTLACRTDPQTTRQMREKECG